MSGRADRSSLQLRTLRPEVDIPGLLQLLQEVEAVDGTDEDADEDAVRATMRWSGHDPASDRWVMVDPERQGQLVAHALAWKGDHERSADVAVAVHPHWRRRGIGAALLSCAVDRARAMGATAVRLYADEQHPAAAAFLRRQGFEPAAAFTEMRFPDDCALTAPRMGPGYTLRAYRAVQDVQLLAYAMTESYHGQWGHHAVSAEDLGHWLPDWREDGIFLLFDATSEVIGLCRAELRAPQRGRPLGYVDAPGIVPAHRGEDLYVSLLMSGMHWLREQGVDAIGLESWGDAESTLERYSTMGFATVRRAISYRREL